MAALLQSANVHRALGEGDVRREIIRGVDLAVEEGEFVALTGASGSGKSTLLYLLGVLDKPTSGEVFVEGRPTSSLGDEARAGLRSRYIGFVFQFHYLLPEFTALENVLVPQLKLGVLPESKARERSRELLFRLGIADKADRKPNQLSGGEQQRVAIARALSCRPRILLADEPTGNLDSANTENVFHIFEELSREGLTIVMVTHDSSLSDRTSRKVRMKDGLVE